MASPLIAALLNGGFDASKLPQAQDVPEENAITVQNDAIPGSKLHQGLVRGKLLGVGTTGGNILGALGDAFLAQAGRGPMYAPRLQQARAAEALQDFTTDPLQAIQRYTQVNPEGAVELQMKQQDAQRDKALSDARIRAAQSDYEDAVHSRAGGLIGAATDQNTYNALRKRYNDYYAAKGVEPLVDLPETYDPKVLSQLMRTGIDARNQVLLNQQREYQTGRLAATNEANANRNSYYNSRTAETARHNRASEATAAQRARDAGTKPPTTSSVIGGILAKQAAGQTLTPSEQAVLQYNKPPKTTNVGPLKFKIVNGKRVLVP